MESNFNRLDFETKKAIIETLIFVSDEPLKNEQIYNIIINLDKDTSTPLEQTIDEEFQKFTDELEKIIETINNELELTNRPYQIIKIANGWQFATRKGFGRIVRHYYKSKQVRRLSAAALEVLAIIAYLQPITKPEIEMIRGVNSSETVNSLLEKNLIKISGRKSVIGRPLEYSTTDDFLKMFGLNSLEDLPDISEFEELVRRELEQQDSDVTLDVSQEKIETIEAKLDDLEMN